MVRMVPANEQDYARLHLENQLLIQYLLIQSPEHKISVSLADIDAASLSIDPKALVRVQVDEGIVTFDIHVPEVEYPYPNTTWVSDNLSKTLLDYLVPHG